MVNVKQSAESANQGHLSSSASLLILAAVTVAFLLMPLTAYAGGEGKSVPAKPIQELPSPAKYVDKATDNAADSIRAGIVADVKNLTVNGTANPNITANRSKGAVDEKITPDHAQSGVESVDETVSSGGQVLPNAPPIKPESAEASVEKESLQERGSQGQSSGEAVKAVSKEQKISKPEPAKPVKQSKKASSETGKSVIQESFIAKIFRWLFR